MLFNWTLVSPWLFVGFAFLFGAVVGSFVNAAIHRLPRDISMLTKSRSFCPQCERQIDWYDNIPILSYLWLAGLCRGCGKKIPLRYLIVELLVATLFTLAAYQFFVLNRSSTPGVISSTPGILFVIQWLLIADLICIAFTDLETWYIPFATTMPWLLLGLVLAPLFPELHLSPTPWTLSPRWNALIDSIQGVILGGGILWGVGFVCLVLIKKQGMGGGDVHLVAMIGALLGWKQALITILLGVFLGTIIGVSKIIWDRYQQARLGPAWKPTKPSFEMPENDDSEPPDAKPILIMGLLTVSFEALVWFTHLRTPGQLWIFEPWPSVALGAGLGFLMILAFPMYRQMIASGEWGQGEIKEREDGKKEEVLEGNYIPFGPSLALAGLVVIFYDPLIRSFMEWWFFRSNG